MSKGIKFWILLLRLSMGWIFFYAGITKVLDPEWTSKGYLDDALTFSGFYQALAAPNILTVVDLLNEWGLTLLGVSLILGAFVRFSGILGAALMLLYYFPVLDFPNIRTTSFVVDQHIVYALVLILLSASKAGRYWGLDKRWRGY